MCTVRNVLLSLLTNCMAKKQNNISIPCCEIETAYNDIRFFLKTSKIFSPKWFKRISSRSSEGVLMLPANMKKQIFNRNPNELNSTVVKKESIEFTAKLFPLTCKHAVN